MAQAAPYLKLGSKVGNGIVWVFLCASRLRRGDLRGPKSGMTIKGGSSPAQVDRIWNCPISDIRSPYTSDSSRPMRSIDA